MTRASSDISDMPVLLAGELADLAAVFLFGSRARGEARADSDWDFAVLSRGRPFPPEALHQAREALAEALNADVDLVDLATAPLPLVREVIAEGKLLEAFDPTALAFFEVRALRDYIDLKERRAGIEADIVARGSVYGPPR